MSNEINTPSDSPVIERPRRRVFQNALFSILLKAQGAIFSYIITRLLLRSMAVEDYGLYSVLFTGVLYNLPILVKLGIPNLLNRFIPELYSQSRYRTISRVFRTVNFLQIGVAVVVLILIYILAPQLAVLIKFPGSETIIRIFSIGILAFILQDNVQMLFNGLFKQRLIFGIVFIYNLIRLISILYITQYAYSLQSVIIVEVVAYVISLTIYFLAYHFIIHPLVAQDKHPDKPVEWKRFTRYTGLSYVNELGTIMAACDLFLVTGILGATAVGLYGFATKITTMLSHVLPYQILRWVIEPLFFSEYGASKRESVQFGYTLLIKATIFATLPVGIWLALMARPVIIHLFEPRYADAAGIVAVLALFLTIRVLQPPLGLIIQNAERVDLLIYAKIAGVIKIVLSLWLVPKGGVMAMVWISGLAVLLQDVIFYVFTVTKLKTKTDLVGLLRLAINGAIAAFLFLQIRYLFTGLGGVFLSVLCFGGIYLVINMIHRTFRSEERAFINKHLPYPLWKF